MDDELVLHPQTRLAIHNFLAQPVHALLLTGLPGSGKAALARLLIGQLLQDTLHLPALPVDAHPHVRIIKPEDNKGIPIGTVRDVHHFLTLKIPGGGPHKTTSAIKRAVLFEDAHLMTLQAQNALLKTLEEPPLDTIIVLTAPSAEALLPTIRSRTRELPVAAPPSADLAAYFKQNGYDVSAVNRAITISGGLPGLASALLQEDNGHPLLLAAEQARSMLHGSLYERLALVDVLSKQRQSCLDIVTVLGQMSRLALENSRDSASARRWQRILRAAYDAEEQLAHNVQAKLVLTNLMLAI